MGLCYLIFIMDGKLYEKMVTKVQKRDKTKEDFNIEKIRIAIWKALTATKQGNGENNSCKNVAARY